MMGVQNDNPAPGTAGLMLSLLAGATLGAAGLGWYLLNEAERRRQGNRQGSRSRVLLQRPATPVPTPDRDLHDRVHELNQAIEDVRRQLETMNTQG